MLCFPLRRKGWKEDLPKSRDCGIFRGLRSPKDSLGTFRWPTGSDPDPGKFSLFCRRQWPGKGWELSEAEPWNWDGIHNSRGTTEMSGGDPRCVQADGKEPWSCRNAEIQEEKLQVENIPNRIQQLGTDVREKPPVPCRARNVPRCAEVDGKAPEFLEKLGSCGNAEIQLKVENAPSRIQQLGKDVREKPPVPCRARNGNVPREGTDQPRPLLQAGNREDQEGQSGGSSRSPECHGQGDMDTAAAPGREMKLPSAAGMPGMSGTERRRLLWERLCQLEQDMAGLEGESTAALAARLAQLILEKPTESYPAEPAIPGVHPEQRSGASQDLQLGVPDVSIPGNDAGNDRIFLSMLRVCGNVESRKDSEQNEEEEVPSMHIHEIQLEPGIPSVHPEQRSGAGQNLELGVPNVPIHGNDAGNDRIFIGMLRVCGNVESREDSEQDEDSDEEFVHPQIRQIQLSEALQKEFPAASARHPLDCGRLAQEERLDGDAVPFQKQWRKPRRVEEQMAELLQKYLAEGIVEEGFSASNNPLILKRKRSGRGWRLTLNCTALKKATPVGPSARLDRIAVMASISPCSRFFSVLDLCSASLAVPLARSCWPRFAFTFRGRQYLFTRLPPTFHGAIVHHRVAAMLARLEPRAAHGVLHYSDDILITGKSRRQVEYRTRKVLELIQRTGFKVGWWKAQLVQPEVNYLGITVGAAGWSIPEEKVDEICEECDNRVYWNARGLKSILGKFNSWRGFIPNYSELERPLRRLTGKQEWGWEWGRQQRQQLQQLQEALQKAPVLRFADKSRPFLIRISLRAETAGAALLQEQQGILLPVRFHSRSMRGQPRAKCQSAARQDLGCLEAVWAVQAFQAFTGPAPVLIQDASRNYLVRGDPFSSDGSDGSQLPEQWTLLLTTKRPKEFDFQNWMAVTLEAPRLRQLPPHVPKANVWFLAVEQGSSQGSPVGFAAVSMEERWLLGVSRGNSKEEAELEALQGLLEKHRSSSPLYVYPNRPHLEKRLMRKDREQGRSGSSAWLSVRRWLHTFPNMLHIREVGMAGKRNWEERDWDRKAITRAKAMAGRVGNSQKIWEPSKHERQEILAQCHLRHEGVEETLARVRRVERWEGDRADVERWVRSCPRCREIDPDGPDPTPQRAEGPWSRLRIWLSSALPHSPEGFRALLVVQDALSGWLDAFPLRQLAEPEVTQTLLREVFGRFGTVRSVALARAPAWLWDSLRRAPLRDFWSRLEHSEPHEGEAAECLIRVAQGARNGWAGLLPLILAASRSLWIDRAELSPLLCIPGLPLELRWESAGEEHCGGNELSWLGGMEVMRPEYRDRLAAALQ